MKKKFVFIVPYFGKFHPWFQLWLNSCANNTLVDWIIFTDDKTSYRYPSNVIVNYCTFDDIKAIIQEKYTFPISLEFPFKLCDFRPAYGEIFADYLKGYDFWGYCDTDLIWGDLSKWLDREDINDYDRISHWGHCSLFRNDPNINSVYKLDVGCVKYYKDVFTKKTHCAFDEEPGFNVLSRAYGIKELIIPFFDVNPPVLSYKFTGTYMTSPFFIKGSYNKIFVVDKNGVCMYAIGLDGELCKMDFAYVHLQRRKMKTMIEDNIDRYAIVPNKFIPFSGDVTINTILELIPSKLSLAISKQKTLWRSRYAFIKKKLVR